MGESVEKEDRKDEAVANEQVVGALDWGSQVHYSIGSCLRQTRELYMHLAKLSLREENKKG